jgi:DNA-binding NtrC family response regulator
VLFRSLQVLRRERPSLDAIVMSGHDQVSQDDALRAGALDFIRKDFVNAGSFLQLLDHALLRRRAGTPADAPMHTPLPVRKPPCPQIQLPSCSPLLMAHRKTRATART